jgi:16S rRNA processing protein RimM
VNDTARTEPHVEVVIGRIGRPHGVGGEVVVKIRTDEPERRFVEGATIVAERERDGTRRSLVLESMRPHNDDLLVCFAGIGDRTAAEDIGGSLLMADVAIADRPDDEDEFYDHQLIGLTAVGTDGSPIGEVREVLHLPLQDALSVVDADGRELLFPFVAEIVTDVRVTDSTGPGRVTIAAPEGLLDLDE